MAQKKRRKGQRLNDTVIAALPYRSKQYTVWDLSVEGCGVRVSAASKACVISVRSGAGRKFKTVGLIAPDSPYEFLREKAIKEIARLKRGRLPRYMAPDESTLQQVLDDYVASHPQMKVSTATDYKVRMNRDFFEQLNQPIVLLTSEEILRLNDERNKKLEEQDSINRPPRGFYSWQSSLRSLRVLVSWYAAKKKRPNPWPDRRVLPLKPPAARELPVELQCTSGRRRLIEGLKVIDSPTARGCLFLCYTGFRKGEGMALAPSHLLAESVVEFQSKTRKLRVPLSRQAAALIDRESTSTLLNISDNHLRKPLNRIFGVRATSRSKRSRVTPHDLRRYFKTVGTELGIDPTVMNLLVGHTIKGVDKHYIAKLRLGVLKTAAQRIADEIENPREIEGEEDILVMSDSERTSNITASRAMDGNNTVLPLQRRADDYLRTGDDLLTPIDALRNPYHVHYLSREELYKLVWTAPMSELKLRFGLSDRGLAKICSRANVPVPGRGYWTKVESGQSVPIPLLGKAPHGVPRLVRIRGTVSPPPGATPVQNKEAKAA